MEDINSDTKNYQLSEWCSNHVLRFLNDIAGQLSSSSVKKAVIKQLFQHLFNNIHSLLESNQSQLTKKGSRQLLLDILFLRTIFSDYLSLKTDSYSKILVDNLIQGLEIEKEQIDHLKQTCKTLAKKHAISIRNLL